MKAFLRQQRIFLVCAVAAVCISAVFFLPQIPQDTAYHNFADKRNICGIPNFSNVSSNGLFVLAGAAGLITVWRKKTQLKQAPVWLSFFAAVFLTGFGSSYYHLTPDNHTLVWDRLPMTVAFMSLFSAFVAERIDVRTGSVLFPLLVGAGIGSVWYWDWTENMGQGDLRFYALVQFLPIILIFLILIIFPAQHAGTKYFFYTFVCYALAKLLEHFDSQVYTVTSGIVSGHTLKHIAAAAGTGCMIGYVACLADRRKEIQ